MRSLVALLLLTIAARADEPFIALPGATKAKSFADVADVSAKFEPARVEAGGKTTLKLTVTPKPGCYTYPVGRRGKAKNSYLEFPTTAPVVISGAIEKSPGTHDVASLFDPGVSDLHYTEAVTFSVPVTVRADAPPGKTAVSLSGSKIQVCNASTCFDGKRDELPKPELEILAAVGGTQPAAVLTPAAQPDTPPPAAKLSTTTPADHAAKLDAIQAQLTDATVTTTQAGFAGLIAAAVFWGFVSLATPCVFPMIPITVSLFLKQSEQSTGTVLRLAAVYSLTIVVVLGSAAVLLLTTFQALSVNEWMNIFLGGLFVFFAMSLFGAFEVTLPRVVSLLVGFGWLFVIYHAIQLFRGINLYDDPRLNIKLAGGVVLLAGLTWFQLSGRGAALESRLLQGTERGRKAGGILGTIAGAMAFSIVSFTCVAPFLGGFAGVLQGSGNSQVALIAAGLAFAAAFASPFFVLALFPSLVKQLPKSGGWLDTVKAVMGFLELAAGFKFFRTAEQKVTGSAQFFTYELCLAAWVAISVAAGLYLLRFYRLPHDYEENQPVGVGQLILALLFLSLGAYLAPGLAGHRPAGGVYAWTNAFLLPDSGGVRDENGLNWSPDLQAALDAARQKPNGRVFLDFTGVTCSNCKLNEKNVFPKPEVVALFKQYSLAQLYTDTLPQEFSAGDAAAGTAIAEVNYEFQRAALGTTQLPLYVILAPEGDRVRVVSVYDEGKINDVARFVAFLEKGLRE